MNRSNSANPKLPGGSLRRDSACGAAFVELAITVAVVLFLIFAGLEFSRALRTIEVASLISREAASVAFRDCAADRGDKLSACLELTRQDIESLGRQISNGEVDVVLSFFQPLPDGSISRVAFAASGRAASTVDQTLIGDVARRQRLLVVAEAYVSFQSVFSNKRRVLWFRPARLYDLTII